ncbi:MAG: glycosyltransferase family 4 protein [Winogradskyella sp.]|uniref:glycosyltransferase family 4 protein n=1 Tax=Winogradskyella sp. TaxID=1883156 RepID=UPI00385F0786
MINNDILIIYGSLNSVPSPEGAAPAKVIYETVLTAEESNFKVLSNYNPKLDDCTYDKTTFKHVKSNIFDSFALIVLKILYPYKRRKKKFITGSDFGLLYFISVCRFLVFNRYKKIVVHVSVGLVSMIKLVFPNREVVFYHHGTSLHSKYSEEQWKALITNSKAIFAVNKIALQKANETFKNQLNSSRYFTIPNAIIPKVTLKQATDFYKNRHYGKNDFVFAFSGRICIEKGVLNLLKAFKKVYGLNKNMHLVVFGAAGTRGTHNITTDYLRQCHDFAMSNDIPVKFRGFVENDKLLKVVSEVDVVVSSTDNMLYQEGMPLSLIEAISIGKPIIATNSGGNFEVVKNNENGFLVRSNPYIEELAEAMLKISADKELYEKLSKSAYTSYLDNHSYESYNRTFKEALKAINFFNE